MNADSDTNSHSMERLFRENYTAMLTLAGRLLHDGDEARDIVHDVFAALLAERPPRITRAWLLGAVRYACLDRMRRLSSRERFLRCLALDTDEIAADEWPDEEDVERLNALVESLLTEQCRRVVRLRFAERLTYVAIAAELGISEAAVYKHLRHAITVLRTKFPAR